MRVFISLFSLLSTIMLSCISWANAAHVAPISQYGQIQNVQNYSSNPLWNPYGPYNQTFPRPVYVDGPDLNSGDCERTVSALVASLCAVNNNCHGMQLSDIRPSIMLQLSRLPGHNWATQCMGYIDNAFSEYQSTAQNHVPTNSVSFPSATVPSSQPTEYKIKNPFAPQVPDWAKEMQERKQELKQLQSQTSNYDTSVSYSRFPKTYQDLSFAEQLQIKQEGYDVFKGMSSYQQITIEKAKAVTPVSRGSQSVANNNANNNAGNNGSGNNGTGNGSGNGAGNSANNNIALNASVSRDVAESVISGENNSDTNVVDNNADTESVVNNDIPVNNTECRPFGVNQAMINDTRHEPTIILNPEIPQMRPNSYSRANNPDNVPDGNTPMEKCLNSVWRTVLQVFADNRPQNCPAISGDHCDSSCLSDDLVTRIVDSVSNIYATNANCVAVRASLNGQCYIGIIPYGNSTDLAWYGSLFAVRFGGMNYIFNSCENLKNETIYTNIGI